MAPPSLRVAVREVLMGMDETLSALNDALQRVDTQTGQPGFRDAAKAFEHLLRSSGPLRRSDRESLWTRYQAHWDKHRNARTATHEASAAAKTRYLSQLQALDYSYDGAPLFQTFSNFARVGEKIRACRSEIKAMQAAIKADATLLSHDRKEIRDRIDIVWQGISASEEVTFSVHGQRADQLYDEAARAVEDLPVREAAPILKVAAAEFRSLWLERGKRDRMRGWFDTLFQRLTSRYEEHKARHDEWRQRQTDGLDRLRSARSKAQEALERARANRSANLNRLPAARSSEHQDRVEGWIREGEDKIRDIEQSLREIDNKIADAEDRLQQR